MQGEREETKERRKPRCHHPHSLRFFLPFFPPATPAPAPAGAAPSAAVAPAPAPAPTASSAGLLRAPPPPPPPPPALADAEAEAEAEAGAMCGAASTEAALVGVAGWVRRVGLERTPRYVWRRETVARRGRISCVSRATEIGREREGRTSAEDGALRVDGQGVFGLRGRQADEGAAAIGGVRRCEHAGGSRTRERERCRAQVDQVLRGAHLSRTGRPTAQDDPPPLRRADDLPRSRDPVPPPPPRVPGRVSRCVQARHAAEDELERDACAREARDEAAFEREGEAWGEGGVEGYEGWGEG